MEKNTPTSQLKKGKTSRHNLLLQLLELCMCKAILTSEGENSITLNATLDWVRNSSDIFKTDLEKKRIFELLGSKDEESRHLGIHLLAKICNAKIEELKDRMNI